MWGSWVGQNGSVPTERKRVRLATTHELPAYGGIALPRQAIDDLADAVGSGAMPMHFEHDISRPVTVANVEAGVEQLEDGECAAWAEFDVDADVWLEYEKARVAAGAPGGMSISFTGPLTGRSMPTTAALVVAADAHHFDEGEIEEAVAILARLDVEAGGEFLYQFSFEPLVKVLFDIVWPTVAVLGPNIVASAIYDAARSFFRPGRKGLVFNVTFKESHRGTRKLKIHIEAADHIELAAAMDRLPEVLRAGTEGTFASTSGGPLEQVELAPIDELLDAPDEQPE